MKLYILDSDTLSLLQTGHAPVSAHFQGQQSGRVAITVITVDEQLRGWYTLVRKAKTPHHIALAYDRLARSVSHLSKIPILTYSVGAIHRFETLRRTLRQVGSNDLRIAAIALEFAGIVVTRNLSDFKSIPGLIVEDWSREPEQN